MSQSDINEFKQRVADATVVYTLFSIAYKIYSNWRALVDRISDVLNSEGPEPEEEPQSTIHDSESESEDDEEE